MARKLDELAGKGELLPERFLACWKEIRIATRKKDEAVAVLRVVKKRAKDAGVDLDALALYEKLSNMEPEDAAARMANVRRYQAWDGTGEQADLFAEPEIAPVKAKASEEHARHKAWETGFDHAKAGGAREDCTYALGNELNQCWTAGFDECVAGNAKADVLPGVKKASTARALRTPESDAATAEAALEAAVPDDTSDADLARVMAMPADKSVRAIADELGMSKSRVSRLQAKGREMAPPPAPVEAAAVH